MCVLRDRFRLTFRIVVLVYIKKDYVNKITNEDADAIVLLYKLST